MPITMLEFLFLFNSLFLMVYNEVIANIQS